MSLGARSVSSNTNSIGSSMSTAPRCAMNQGSCRSAATLIADVVDPYRFARWSGTGPVEPSSGEGAGAPVRHRLDFGGNRRVNSVLYIASVTQHRDIDDASV